MIRRRNTPAKQAVLDVLQASNAALSQDEIEKRVKGAMDRVTVYRVLNSFCEDGYLHRIVSDEGKTYFAVCVHCDEHTHRHDHFHFRCLTCGKVECMKQEVEVKVPRGYHVQGVNCLLTGTCRACA